MNSLTNFAHSEKWQVKHIGQIGAGSTVDIFGYPRKSYIARPQWAQKPEQVATAEVCGDSLLDEDIRNGDKLVCKIIFDKSEVAAGKLVVAKLPTGLSVIKRIYFDKNKIILRSSNSKYKDLVYDKNDIEIEAIVKELIRKLD